jgi:hypothetical protein
MDAGHWSRLDLDCRQPRALIEARLAAFFLKTDANDTARRDGNSATAIRSISILLDGPTNKCRIGPRLRCVTFDRSLRVVTALLGFHSDFFSRTLTTGQLSMPTGNGGQIGG